MKAPAGGHCCSHLFLILSLNTMQIFLPAPTYRPVDGGCMCHNLHSLEVTVGAACRMFSMLMTTALTSNWSSKLQRVRLEYQTVAGRSPVILAAIKVDLMYLLIDNHALTLAIISSQMERKTSAHRKMKVGRSLFYLKDIFRMTCWRPKEAQGRYSPKVTLFSSLFWSHLPFSIFFVNILFCCF